MLVTSRWSVNDKRHVDADSSTLHTPLKSEDRLNSATMGAIPHWRTFEPRAADERNL